MRSSDRITVLRNGELRRRISGGRAAAAGADHRDGRARARGAGRRPRTRVRATSRGASGAARRSGIGPARPVAPLDLDVRRGEVRGPRRACSAPAAPSSRGCCSASTAPTAASCGRRRSRCAALAGAMRSRTASRCAPRTARPKASSPSCRCARTSCWRCRRGWAAAAPVARAQQAEIAERLRRALGIKTRRRSTRRSAALRRQPAEGAAGALARDRAAAADPRRADARHRRRRQAGNHGRRSSALAREGMAVLFISSEMDEVVRVADRIAVLRDRRKVGELPGGSAEQAVYHLIAAGAPDDASAAPCAMAAASPVLAARRRWSCCSPSTRSSTPASGTAVARRPSLRQPHRHPQPRRAAGAGRARHDAGDRDARHRHLGRRRGGDRGGGRRRC